MNFEFELRTSKFPTCKMATGKTPAAKYMPVTKVAKNAVAKKAVLAKKAAAKAPRKTGPGLKPSAPLVAITEVIKKLWNYIKANGLQDAANKRAINADTKSCCRCSASYKWSRCSNWPAL